MIFKVSRKKKQRLVCGEGGGAESILTEGRGKKKKSPPSPEKTEHLGRKKMVLTIEEGGGERLPLPRAPEEGRAQCSSWRRKDLLRFRRGGERAVAFPGKSRKRKLADHSCGGQRTQRALLPGEKSKNKKNRQQGGEPATLRRPNRKLSEKKRNVTRPGEKKRGCGFPAPKESLPNATIVGGEEGKKKKGRLVL